MSIPICMWLSLGWVSPGTLPGEVAERLRQMHREVGQGFSLGRPAPPEHVAALLAGQEQRRAA